MRIDATPKFKQKKDFSMIRTELQKVNGRKQCYRDCKWRMGTKTKENYFLLNEAVRVTPEITFCRAITKIGTPDTKASMSNQQTYSSSLSQNQEQLGLKRWFGASFTI
ncbi:hypothetical protein Avbf_13694 [Armadillidium vulgare]|nr:hypothetical protein Avbf_13694 [Armadillidium vulgare]